MTRTAVLLLLPALLFAARHPKPKPRRSAPPVPSGPVSIIEDVSVIDIFAAQTIPHQDIVIRGDRIAAVRPALHRTKQVRYAIPGLWDMHVHLWFPHSQFPLYLANGVTGVRDMGSGLKRVREWQRDPAAPRIYTGGDPVSGRPSDTEDMPVHVITTPQEARTIFNSFYDQQVNFIKVLDVSPAVFEALAEASRHGGIPFAGHVPLGVSAFEAAADRMVSMEHLFGIPIACARRENELRRRALAARDKRDRAEQAAVTQEAIKNYDPVGALALWDTFRRYEVRQTPTLSLWERMAGLNAALPEIRYVDAAARAKWKETPPEADKAQFDFALRLTGDMAKAGVGILAGTDTGDPGTVPGVSLHHELELLVRAGLTPAQALTAATLEPARLMRRERDYGRIAAGFAADIVLLNANPLENISNTRDIETVVLRGRQTDKAAIRRMLGAL